MKEEILSSIRREHTLNGLVGQHPIFTQVIQKLIRLANKNIAVLLIGETGTGKTRCAEFIHHYSDRHDAPFIICNCGVCPETLFESQLFGHVKGAFTGAYENHTGIIEEAHTGTLFLDDVDSLDLNTQVKLNYFLETGCFRKVGTNKISKVDVRIIAATNINLADAITTNRFREDLFYRLSEYDIEMPPLRMRKEEIKELVDYFVMKYKDLTPQKSIRFSEKALNNLKNYDWPGNIRQLEKFIKRCLVDADSSVIENICLPNVKKRPTFSIEEKGFESMTWKEAKQDVIEEFEKSYIETLLKKYNGVVAQCAKHAGLHSPDFWRLMRRYEIKANVFR